MYRVGDSKNKPLKNKSLKTVRDAGSLSFAELSVRLTPLRGHVTHRHHAHPLQHCPRLMTDHFHRMCAGELQLQSVQPQYAQGRVGTDKVHEVDGARASGGALLRDG